MSKRWWQFWKFGRRAAGRIFVHGYYVTPGSQLHRSAVEALRFKPGEELEQDVDVQLPGGGAIDGLVEEWLARGHGVFSDEQRKAMHKHEKEIGQALYELGGYQLMKHVALKLIEAGHAYESDFVYWNGIGGWQY